MDSPSGLTVVLRGMEVSPIPPDPVAAALPSQAVPSPEVPAAQMDRVHQGEERRGRGENWLEGDVVGAHVWGCGVEWN